MASVNKVILIGNLGRVSRDTLDAVGQQAFDRYFDALRGYGEAFQGLADKFVDAVRKLAEASRLLHKLAKPFVIPKRITACWMPTFNRTAAFFHAAKVDARNLP